MLTAFETLYNLLADLQFSIAQTLNFEKYNFGLAFYLINLSGAVELMNQLSQEGITYLLRIQKRDFSPKQYFEYYLKINLMYFQVSQFENQLGK